MKKVMILIAMVAMMAVLLTACGKFTCDLCGEEKTGKQHKGEVLGEEVVICNDCKEDLEDIKEGFEDLADALK